MTDIEIFEDLKKIIHRQFAVDEDTIEEESYFDSNLNISELDLEDFIAEVAQKYDIEIPDENIPSFKKVSDLVTYIYESANLTS